VKCQIRVRTVTNSQAIVKVIAAVPVIKETAKPADVAVKAVGAAAAAKAAVGAAAAAKAVANQVAAANR
jgi:hypothetical protein